MGRTTIDRRRLAGLGLAASAAVVAARTGITPAGAARQDDPTPAATPAGTPGVGGELTADDRDVLLGYAAATWASLDAMVGPLGLPSDQIQRQQDGSWRQVPQTSPTNVGCYLWSIVAAEELGFIDTADATTRVLEVIDALGGLERHEGFFFNWYDVTDGTTLTAWPDSGDEIRPFLSSVDNAWLAAGLQVVRNRYPEASDGAAAILADMDFVFFYTPYDEADPVAGPGQMRGGYWPDGVGEFTGHHYGAFNSETRIITYVAIALGTTPSDHYWHVFRTLPAEYEQEQTPSGPTETYDGVEVFEGAYEYRGLRLVPSWGGSMFEALMPPILVPEVEWGPTSWALNHPLFVEAQIQHGMDEAAYGYWGFSPCTVPEGGYQEYGVDAIGQNLDGYASNTDRTYVVEGEEPPGPAAYTNGVVTPHAVFLALDHAPVAVMENLANLAAKFDIVTDYGWLDSVNVSDGTVNQNLLSLDQGMVMGALGNALGDGVIRRAFASDDVTARLRPLVEQERFDVGRIG
jgi:hypothetical protein